MRKKYPVILMLLTFIMFGKINGQSYDPLFSQFNFAPLHLNPAMIGLFEGDGRFSAVYRNQWSSVLGSNSFKTFGVSLDKKFYVGRNDFWAIGMDVVKNNGGQAGFGQTQFNLGGSYLKQMGGGRYRQDKHYLVAGAQFGTGQLAVDSKNIWFSQQFDPESETVDQSRASGENINSTSDLFYHINAGVLWYSIFDDNFSFYAGGAVQKFNEPIATLGTTDFVINRRFTAHAGGQIPIGRYLSIIPKLVWMQQGTSMSSLIGAAIRMNSRDTDEFGVRVGASVRISNKLQSSILADAVIFSSVIEFKKIDIGISYDVNISEFQKSTDMRGTVEFGVTYKEPTKNRMTRVTCPKF